MLHFLCMSFIFLFLRGIEIWSDQKVLFFRCLTAGRSRWRQPLPVLLFPSRFELAKLAPAWSFSSSCSVVWQQLFTTVIKKSWTRDDKSEVGHRYCCWLSEENSCLGGGEEREVILCAKRCNFDEPHETVWNGEDWLTCCRHSKGQIMPVCSYFVCFLFL